MSLQRGNEQRASDKDHHHRSAVSSLVPTAEEPDDKQMSHVTVSPNKEILPDSRKQPTEESLMLCAFRV